MRYRGGKNRTSNIDDWVSGGGYSHGQNLSARLFHRGPHYFPQGFGFYGSTLAESPESGESNMSSRRDCREPSVLFSQLE